MIKKLNTKSFNFVRIIKELQKLGVGEILSDTNSSRHLWDYCNALRGPDIELEGAANIKGGELKALFTAPLRGFKLNHAICLNNLISACQELLRELQKCFPINIFHGMSEHKRAYQHYLFHIYFAWQAIKQVVQNKGQYALIDKIIYQISILHDFFCEEFDAWLSGLTIIGTETASISIKNYVELLTELLETMK